MGIIYRPLLLSEVQHATELMNSAYARQKIPQYFEWLYFSKAVPAQLVGAWEDTKLIGMAGVINRTLDDTTSVGVITDILVDEKHRGKGIFTELIKEIEINNTNEFFCSFTNYYGMSACTKGLGWKVITRIDSLVFSNDVRKQVKSKNETQSGITSFSYLPTFIRWRFEKSPLYSYTLIKNNSGIAVTKIFVDPLTEVSYGDIVYLNSAKNSKTQLNILLTEAMNSLLENDVKEITIWALPHTQRFAICTELGFISKTQERYLCGTVTNTNKDYLLQATAWDIHQSDSEVY